jgi:CheY-like chemotaxis protein
LIRRQRILSVDDDPDVTLTLKTVLENDGYTVDVFNDPIIALENFKKAAEENATNQQNRYGLVLSDVKMPAMSGFDLYQKIRKIDKNIKVRFLTASEINYDEFQQKVAPTTDTQNCFIKKPVENQKLLDVINELLK